MHVSYINTFNMLGLIIGVIVSCCMLLQKKSIRLIWLAGFVLLLAFHVILFFLFDTQANEDNIFAPLFLQGLGVGMLIVPTILYAISSVPTALRSSASAICLAIRYVGFCISIALINFYELYGKSRHYNAFQDSLTQLNPAVSHALVRRSQQLAHKGLGQEAAHKAADKLLVQAVNSQAQIRFAMDYYELMAWLLIGTLGLIIAFPYLNRTVIYLKSRRLAPIQGWLKNWVRRVFYSVEDFPNHSSEVLFTLSAGTKDQVDNWEKEVERTGGKIICRPKEFEKGYYGLFFADPDGHKFNVFYMERL